MTDLEEEIMSSMTPDLLDQDPNPTANRISDEQYFSPADLRPTQFAEETSSAMLPLILLLSSVAFTVVFIIGLAAAFRTWRRREDAQVEEGDAENSPEGEEQKEKKVNFDLKKEDDPHEKKKAELDSQECQRARSVWRKILDRFRSSLPRVKRARRPSEPIPKQDLKSIWVY